LLDIPVSQWVHIEVAAGLGPQSTGTWDLTVTLPGEQPRKFAKLPNGSPNWKTLDWLGFIGDANEKTACYLDNLDLTHE
jgi:hypothetical protein